MQLAPQTIRRLFVTLLVLLPLQYAFTGLVGAVHRDPWPTLVMPAFQKTWQEEIDVEVPQAYAVFDGDSLAEVDLHAVLDALPRSHHRRVVKRHFRSAEFSDEASHLSRDTEGLRWLRSRLDELGYAGAESLDVIWTEQRYPISGAISPTASIPLDTLRLDLP